MDRQMEELSDGSSPSDGKTVIRNNYQMEELPD